ADSISILTASDIPQGAQVIDVGTGGGFPGVPLLIMRPGINLTLLDSTAKKIDFVSEVVSELGLKAETISGRAEELAKEPGRREKYDFCVSRAVASLNVLSELCLPFLRTGGIFISMKGAKASEELDAAEGALKALGAETEKTLDVKLGDGFERKLIVIRKTGETDSKFPRQYGQILKRPL
ncbi:MAG: 16S rRNA (guanine(527)-N(7))-methyltransferase RsmG, partial [Clostridia bacterium]|nr:16S rRNA (guanine(527)-N(7))-methyltransferase RsmG [Clostridia bacterium]